MRERAASFAQQHLSIASRRAILKAGAAVLALGFTPSWSKTNAMSLAGRSDLFAFEAPSSNNCVFAVLLPENHTFAVPPSHGAPVVQVHAGQKNWAIPVTREGWTEFPDARSFVGPVHFSTQNPLVTRVAVVIETAPDLLDPGQSLDVWAEIRDQDGSRSRMGNPFVAEVIARNPALSNIYHRITPDQDLPLLAEAFAAGLANMSIGVANPRAHGRRLASILLPDVIKYRPGAPVGFSFADRNGRHPADPVKAVVETLLAGTVVPGRMSETVNLGNVFPYFPTGGVLS
jgi:hypothetical protein